LSACGARTAPATTLTFARLVDEYLAQHDAQPETIANLRWLLTKAVAEFGDRRLGELRSQEIAAWRMTIAAGHRFEATQALRQVLSRAVAWGMIDVNPAKQGVDNPQRRRTEKRPFESSQLAAVASRLDACSGALVMFAAATGLRPGEWIALERRDIDEAARVVYVRDRPPGRLQPARRSRRPPGGRRVDTSAARRRHLSQQKRPLAGETSKPSDGLEPSTPSLPWRCSTN